MDNIFLNYEMFGAVGDGVADDMAAIIACHEEANRTGTPVKTKDGAKYYINGKKRSAIIKTNVDFGTSEFIIDDRNLESIMVDVFSVPSDFQMQRFDAEMPLCKDKKFKINHGGRALVRIFDDNRMIYIRKGLNQSNGNATTDIFIVDEDGNITTDLDWEYSAYTVLRERQIDEVPLYIKGGIFTTIANQSEPLYRYHWRGIGIRRDNVTIEAVAHYVTGEGEQGCPYRGFIDIQECIDVTVKNCLLTPHFIYRTESQIPGKKVNMGTYDINIAGTIRTKLVGIRQTIDIMDKRYWGLMGSNFCKETVLEDCVISRYDSHMGVTNCTIRDCTLGHQCLNIIGSGKFLIENTELLGRSLINLREDYGSTWHGDMTIKNCIWHPMTAEATVFRGINTGEHDFGYTCYMPTNITIDGLKILDGEFADTDKNLYFLFSYDKDYEEGKEFPYITTKNLTVAGVETESGREVLLCPDERLYPGISFIRK